MTDQPLCDRFAEQGVLGALILDQDPARVFPVRELLPTPEVFGFAAHREIYAALLALLDAGTAIDTITLMHTLEGRKALEAVGGAGYLAELVDAVPTAANIEHHAGIVRGWYLRRLVAQQGERLLRLANDRDLAATDLLAQSVADLTATAVGTVTARRRGWGELLCDVGEQLEARVRSGKRLLGVSSGFPDLDRLTLGWRPGDLAILAARPSVGKSSFALQLARNAAVAFQQAREEGPPPVALVVSIEMGQDDLVERLLAAEANVPIHDRIRRGSFTDQDVARIAQAQAHLGALPIRIIDQATHHIGTPGQIRLAIQHFAATERRRIGLVVVDYLQYLEADGAVENRNREVGQMTKALKTMSLQLGFPTILLSQLSRENVKANRRPQLTDLRDSGEIEQDADLVLFLHRDEKAPDWGPAGKTEAILAKHRNGETGDFLLSFTKETQRWTSFLHVEPEDDRGMAA